MRCHWLQHVPYEGLGHIGSWLEGQGAEISVTQLYAGEPLPPIAALGELDWLIIMGGPMGVHDECRYPWMAAEKRLIRAALAGGPRVLGICLGAQLIADVLGGRVAPMGHQEIGWHPVTTSAAAASSPLLRVLPDRFAMFHWHGEMFETPPAAVPLGSSAGCVNQGFALGSRVLALQCHPEMTHEAAGKLVATALAEWPQGAHVQSPEGILGGDHQFAALAPTMVALLEAMQAG
jgi:GMP synthase-like glutamine amidotransferase